MRLVLFLRMVHVRPLRGKRKTNELRKINTVMSTDLTRSGILEARDSTVSSAENMLRDNSHNAEAGQRNPVSFQRLAGSVVGALRSVASRTAKERGQWAVQQSPPAEQGLPRDADGSTADQVRLGRVQAVVSRFLMHCCGSFSQSVRFELVRPVLCPRWGDFRYIIVSTACCACSTLRTTRRYLEVLAGLVGGSQWTCLKVSG